MWKEAVVAKFKG